MNINPYLDEALPGDREALRAVKTYMIPVSGGVRLYGPEIEVVDTPEFQRLAGIKQLGTTDVVFRGARHTRFEHSLGTVHEANRMVRALLENPRKPFPVPPQAWRLARLGALLHDVPHVPYGHTLEDELGLLKRHDQNDDRWNALVFSGRIGEILRRTLGDEETSLLGAHLKAKDDKQNAIAQMNGARAASLEHREQLLEQIDGLADLLKAQVEAQRTLLKEMREFEIPSIAAVERAE